MRKIYKLALYVSIILFPSIGHTAGSQSVDGTVIVQQQIHNGTQWVNQKGDGGGVAQVNIASNETSVDRLYGTTFLFYEATSAVTNVRILTTPAGSTIYVKQYSIISMDDVNKGTFIIGFNNTNTDPFAKGKIGVAPSGTGEPLYCPGYNQGIWVTTPGACIIKVHYTTSVSY